VIARLSASWHGVQREGAVARPKFCAVRNFCCRLENFRSEMQNLETRTPILAKFLNTIEILNNLSMFSGGNLQLTVGIL